MRRADRLFLIIHALRGRRRALPARSLAETLGISLRTVYRDVADLQRSGVPIEGEAGVGYMLRHGADIPPLMFNAAELEALVVGSRFVQAFGGDRLSLAARAAMLKIVAVLPADLRERSGRTRIFAPEVPNRIEARGVIERINAAIEASAVLQVRYRDEAGHDSEREIEPLCLVFWGNVWTVGAWCRARADFRTFRADRMLEFAATGAHFVETRERGLVGYLQSVGASSDAND
jgi:predicted DNA-binding transcriptional regulator YafY